MTEQTIDQTTKRAVLEAVREQANAALAASRERFGHERAAAEVDQDDSVALDDLSQSDEAGDLAGFAADAIAEGEATLATLDQLDLAATDVVRAGAVVAFDGARYLVGVAAAAVTVDGVPYEGISADSPVFAAIDGKRAGETFTVAGTDHTLDLVG